MPDVASHECVNENITRVDNYTRKVISGTRRKGKRVNDYEMGAQLLLPVLTGFFMESWSDACKF